MINDTESDSYSLQASDEPYFPTMCRTDELCRLSPSYTPPRGPKNQMSKMIVHRDPSSGVTQPSGARSQLSIGVYGQAETALEKGCKMIRCLQNSISDFRLAVTIYIYIYIYI